jgi:hypothetical protein
VAGLEKSNLLFGRLGSTVPGFVEIGDGGAGEEIGVVWESGAVGGLPDLGKQGLAGI